MPNSFTSTVDYFFHEGKENLHDCLRAAFDAAISRDVRAIVIFTAIGEGPRLAVENYLSQREFSDIKVIAVTFPYGQRFRDNAHVEISPETRHFLAEHGVNIVRAHLPFNPIGAHHHNHGMLGQDLALIGNALSIFGGSMSLCVQAALMACDAGCLDLGEHAIALTSDTAILVRSAPTERLLTDFIIREVICKPLILTIGKSEPKMLPDEAEEDSETNVIEATPRLSLPE